MPPVSDKVERRERCIESDNTLERELKNARHHTSQILRNRYPRPRMVSIDVDLSPSFLRSVLITASMTLLPMCFQPQTSSTSDARETAIPLRLYRY